VDLADRTFIIENYRVAVEDPAAIWADICGKYGFQELKMNQVRVDGNQRSGQVLFVPKVPVTGLNVKIPHYLRRSFEVYIADEPWKSGEVVLRADLGKEAICSHLKSLIPLPDHSQFQIVSGRNEISHLSNWPIGLIVLIPKKFPVTWRIETPDDPSGFSQVVQQDMTPLVNMEEA
jgi:hypothetical protein